MLLKGFTDFILRKGVVEIGVAFVLALAFSVLVGALVADLVTPLIAAIFGEPDFSQLTFTINESVFRYGAFINSLITFVVIAATVYFLVVVPAEKIQKSRRSSAKK